MPFHEIRCPQCAKLLMMFSQPKAEAVYLQTKCMRCKLYVNIRLTPQSERHEIEDFNTQRYHAELKQQQIERN